MKSEVAADVCCLGRSESLDSREEPWWAETERKRGRPERNLRAHCSVGTQAEREEEQRSRTWT